MQQTDEFEDLLQTLLVLENSKFKKLELGIKINSNEDPYVLYIWALNQIVIEEFYSLTNNQKKIINEFFSTYSFNSNPGLVSLEMRLIFMAPNYFDSLSCENWTKLMKDLIYLSQKLEEPHSTYAIKCMQVGFHRNSTTNQRKIEEVRELGIFLINQLVLLSSMEEENKPARIPFITTETISIESQTLVPNVVKNRKELEVIDYDIFEILKTPITSNFSQRFHRMVLLLFIAHEIEDSDIVASNTFLRLLYSSMNINECKFEGISCLAGLIMSIFITFPRFNDNFMRSDGIKKICSVPYCLHSCIYVCNILAQISTVKAVMTNICKLYPELIKIMLKYIVGTMEPYSNKDQWIFLKNSFEYDDFFSCFTSFNEMDILIKNLTETDEYNLHTIYIQANTRPAKILEKYTPTIKTALDAISIYLVLRVLQLHPDEDEKFKMFSKTSHIYNSSLNYFNEIENIGGLKGEIQFFNEILTNRFIEWMMLVFLHYVHYGINADRIDWNKFFFFYYIFALYPKSKKIFITDINLNRLNEDFKNTIAEKIKSDIVFTLYSEFQPTLYEVKIFLAIMLSCFESREQYLHLLKNDATPIYFNENEDFNKFSRILINLDLIYYLMIISTNDFDNSQIDVDYRLYLQACCIKILYLLSFDEKACQIMSQFSNYFNKDLPKILIENLEKYKDRPALCIFYEFYLRLIVRINILHKKCLQFPFSLKSQSTGKDSEINRFLTTLVSKIFKRENNEISETEIDTCCNLDHIILINRNSTIFHISKYYYETNEHFTVPLFIENVLGDSDNNDYNKREDLKHETSSFYKSSKFKTKTYFYGQIYKSYEMVQTVDYDDSMNCDKYAKFLNDGNVVLTLSDEKCFRVYLPDFKGFENYSSQEKIIYIKQSHNGQYIVTNGTTDSGVNISSIWKYDPFSRRKKLKPFNQLIGSICPKFSRSDENIFSISDDGDLGMFDVETGIRTSKFLESNTKSFYYFNSIDTNKNDSLVHFNGNLFCVRSGKFVHRFERFNIFTSGKFMPSDIELLIHTQLWDLRTFRLFCTIDDFKTTFVNRTENEEILSGIKYVVPNYFFPLDVDYFGEWKPKFPPSSPDRLCFYSSKNYNKLVEINMVENNIIYMDVSRDATKYLTLFPSCFKIYNICKSQNEVNKDQPLFAEIERN